jgi:hypothetical protein
MTQAKGRIERLWGTFQDRLPSELRLVGATANPGLQVSSDTVSPTRTSPGVSTVA